MAELSELRTKTAQAIDDWYVANQERTRTAMLRCSSIGDPCDRALWYSLRWVSEPEKFDARILRIFENGHMRERVILDMLRGAGLSVREIDEATGAQWRVTLGSTLAGSCDGIADDVPDAPKTPHLIEIKTMNGKRWQDWRRKGTQASNPKYYAQAQLYMHGLGLTRCLFVAENQDTREIEIERIHYDATAALQFVARAERITNSVRTPPRISDDPDWYQCRTCRHHAVCHGGKPALRNCRTCLAATVSGSDWTCQRHKRGLSVDEQERGCSLHLYEPSLVNGEQIDADIDGATVTYRMRDGSAFVDGGETCRPA